MLSVGIALKSDFLMWFFKKVEHVLVGDLEFEFLEVSEYGLQMEMNLFWGSICMSK